MPESLLAPFVDGHAQTTDVEVTPRPAGELPAIDGLLAGAAEVDITPPPGLPKAGHSVHAHDGIGFRSRLRARVIHLRGGTTSLAVVQCDLLAGSSIVQHLVADAVADDTDLRLPGLFIGATHTHAGPGQFHGCDFYNRFSSNRGGFDPAFTDFLVGRIAGAVRQAVATRRPARLATGSTEVWGYTRNRAHDAHIRNETVTDERTEPQRKYAAINPWLHLLRVDATAPDGGYEPLAATAVFSIHGTGISYHDRSYNADVWAYITGELAHRIERATGRRAVVGAVEGTHGDMTPAVRPGMLVFPEAERVGRGIGEAAADLWERLEGAMTDRAELGVGLREIDFTTEVVDGIALPAPAVGTAKLAGARENLGPVVSLIPPFRAGFPNPRRKGPHGAKFIAMGRTIHDRFVPPASFPTTLPLQVIRVGGMAVVGLPFEVTVEAGRRITGAVHDAIGPDHGIDRVVVSSVANEYCDYLTTPEEYTRQCYEGASTLFGPQSQAYVAACAGRLARDVVESGWVAGHLPIRRFSLRSHRFYAVPTDQRVARSIVGQPRFTDATKSEDGYWEMVWRDVAPGDLDWYEPLVRVEAVTAGGDWAPAVRAGRPIDDQGWHVGVVHLGAGKDEAHTYAARWYGLDIAAARDHRFVLLANGGQPELASPSFD